MSIPFGLGVADVEAALSSPVAASDQRARYRVYVTDGAFAYRDELDDCTVEAILRDGAPGSWRVSANHIGPANRWLRFLGLGAGIAITRDDRPILIGILEERKIAERGNRRTITASGRDALVLLEDRWVDPVGGTGGPSYAAQDYDFQSNAAETVMRHYVDVNTGKAARADREVANLHLEAGDGARGGSVAVRGRFDNLLQLLQQIARVADPPGVGLRFEIVESLTVAGRLEFAVRSRRDLRQTVIFDCADGSAAEAELREAAPTASAVVVAGQGQGKARRFLEVPNASAISSFGRRTERFIDRRDTDDTAELAQAAAEALAAGERVTEYKIVPNDGMPWRWGEHYDLGDLVGCRVAGVLGEGVVREVALTIDGRGIAVVPLIGTDGATFASAEARATAALEQRIAFLERVKDEGSIGDIKMTSRPLSELPAGWYVCDGTTLANGYTVQDMRNRVPVGAGDEYAVGGAYGSASANLAHTHTGAPHTHAHKHGPGDLVFAHNHPGAPHSHSHSHPERAHTHTLNSHTHTLNSHTHGMGSHTHDTDLDHNHGAVTSGYTDSDPVAVGHASLGSGATDHKHSVDLPALGATNETSSGPSTANTDGPSTANTGGPSTADTSGTTYTGSQTPDTTAAAYTGNSGAAENLAASGQTAETSTAATFSAQTGSAGGTVTLLPRARALYFVEKVPA